MSVKKNRKKKPLLLVFQGSVRKNGNTQILCREAMKGAKESGMMPRLVRLADLDIEACRGCFRCRDGTCRAHRDDMNALLGEIRRADALIFASPVYFWNVSGLMKMFFDRLMPLLSMRREGDRMRLESVVAGKRAGIIVVQEEEKGPHQSIPMLFFRRNFADFGIEFTGSVLAYGAFYPGDIKRDRKVLEEAKRLGRKLGS